MSMQRDLTNHPLPSTAMRELRGQLRDFTAQRLPGAVVPKDFVVLPELPKLPNGKVDRDRLPRPRHHAGTGADYVAPRTPEEERVAAVWCDVLGLSRVGAHDDFFDLGGGSLAAAQMAARLRSDSGVPINVRGIFDNPTVEKLARMLGPGVAPTSDDTEQHPRSISPQRLAEEAMLAEDVAIEPGAAPAAAVPYREVLLTGATGYTGAFLLRELIDRSTARIHVLVRAGDPETARARILAAMRTYGVAHAGDAERIVPVIGDLARPYLGLDRAAYIRLAGQVEMIVHNGASSSYALPYRRLRPVNVLGTQEILRLAGKSRIKPVHYISSLAVYPGERGDPCWAEGPVPAPDGVVGGYRQSKWVGDSMMTQAFRRGIPTCSYRPGLIIGSQQTGACSTDTLLNAAIKGCVQLGAALEFDTALELVPADFCAAAVAHIALRGQYAGEAFNLPGARPLDWNDLVGLIASHGYAIRRLPYQDWYHMLRDAVEHGEDNELARFMPLFGPELPAEDLGYEGSKPVFEAENLHAALSGSGIVCHEPDGKLIGGFLDWFAATGYLPPPAASSRQQ